MSANTGGPAFPGIDVEVVGISSDGEERTETQAHGGMSLRAYIATKCCAAMVSTIRNDGDYTRLRNIAAAHDLDSVSQFFAQESVKQAGALIAALEAS